MNALRSRAIVAIMAFLPGSSLDAAISKEVADEIATTVNTYVSEDGPGCGVGVVQSGVLVYNHGFGLADLEHDVPVSTDTIFRIGSVSKQFTAASVALLVLRGQLDLDADIRTILTDFPEYQQTITVRHLIGHSGGIPDVYRLIELLGHDPDGNFYPSELTTEMIYRMKELEFDPGSQHEYSNGGYLLLAQIVEAVTDQTLRQFAQENIFAPLGMNHTHFHDNHREIVKNRSYGYRLDPNGQWEVRNSNFYVVGDGGVFTTVADMARWDRNFYENALEGGSQFTTLMQTPFNYTQSEAEFMGKKVGYGFGLFLDEYKGREMIWHPGGWAGFQAAYARFPQDDFSLIMLCNQVTKGMRETFMKLADILLDDE